mmetsp:Transcript_3539/g.11012  ORF Transcript_3539/g.11012 Transcript_3539/m.11012 type:complete len:322 (-) Transcript_3539:374-1339(-)
MARSSRSPAQRDTCLMNWPSLIFVSAASIASWWSAARICASSPQRRRASISRCDGMSRSLFVLMLAQHESRYCGTPSSGMLRKFPGRTWRYRYLGCASSTNHRRRSTTALWNSAFCSEKCGSEAKRRWKWSDSGDEAKMAGFEMRSQIVARLFSTTPASFSSEPSTWSRSTKSSVGFSSGEALDEPPTAPSRAVCALSCKFTSKTVCSRLRLAALKRPTSLHHMLMMSVSATDSAKSESCFSKFWFSPRSTPSVPSKSIMNRPWPDSDAVASGQRALDRKQPFVVCERPSSASITAKSVAKRWLSSVLLPLLCPPKTPTMR